MPHYFQPKAADGLEVVGLGRASNWRSSDKVTSFVKALLLSDQSTTCIHIERTIPNINIHKTHDDGIMDQPQPQDVQQAEKAKFKENEAM